MSTTEAGYINVPEEVIWIWRLYIEIFHASYSNQLRLFDIQRAIKLSENPRLHKCTKHINIK